MSKIMLYNKEINIVVIPMVATKAVKWVERTVVKWVVKMVDVRVVSMVVPMAINSVELKDASTADVSADETVVTTAARKVA